MTTLPSVWSLINKVNSLDPLYEPPPLRSYQVHQRYNASNNTPLRNQATLDIRRYPTATGVSTPTSATAHRARPPSTRTSRRSTPQGAQKGERRVLGYRHTEEGRGKESRSRSPGILPAGWADQIVSPRESGLFARTDVEFRVPYFSLNLITHRALIIKL